MAPSGPCKWLMVLCAAGVNTKCLGFNSYAKNLKDGMDNEVVTLSVRSQLFRFIKTAEEDFRRDQRQLSETAEQFCRVVTSAL